MKRISILLPGLLFLFPSMGRMRKKLIGGGANVFQEPTTISSICAPIFG
jgi:hypothetical protein